MCLESDPGVSNTASGSLSKPHSCHRAAEVGPVGVQSRNGVVDLVVADEAAATAAAKRLLAYFRGPVAPGRAADQTQLRELVTLSQEAVAA